MESPLLVLGGMETNLIPVIAVGGGLCVAIVGIIAWAIQSVFTARAVEQTKREVAAYVAEGSMTPEDAEKIVKSAPNHG